jgi:SEC-C motif
LAAEQDDQKFSAIFRSDDVTRAYAAAPDPTQSHLSRNDPWQFYDPQAIAERQVSWAEDDRKALEREARLISQRDDNFGDVETYVRGSPKIGRNEPCPCGSGKKYKKCCLPRDVAG